MPESDLIPLHDPLDHMERRLAFLDSIDPNSDHSDDEACEIPDSFATQSQNRRQKGRRKANTKVEATAADLGQDELDLYLSEPPVDSAQYKKDPLAWWRDQGARRFPKLSYMASDMLTIPSSTAETERQFNSAGKMITPSRNHLQRVFVSQAQCLRSWSDMGVYRPELPIHLLQDQGWYDRLEQDGFVPPLPEGITAKD